MVGVKPLLEALAIGKGKRDLTTTGEMRRQKKKLQPVCSSLKTEEILNLLKNRIGLSSARLSDLFWEAVWPRLIKNGWHSELPTNFPACQNPKNPLVFLLPGIKKFSRRGLKKGSEYFESFTEVLNKVASEPSLLGPEPHTDPSVNPEHGVNEEQDSVEFTVVEVSSVSMERVLTMRDIRLSSQSKPGPKESRNEDANQTKPLEFPSPLDDLAAISGSKNEKKRKRQAEDITRVKKITFITSYGENGIAGSI